MLTLSASGKRRAECCGVLMTRAKSLRYPVAERSVAECAHASSRPDPGGVADLDVADCNSRVAFRAVGGRLERPAGRAAGEARDHGVLPLGAALGDSAGHARPPPVRGRLLGGGFRRSVGLGVPGPPRAGTAGCESYGVALRDPDPSQRTRPRGRQYEARVASWRSRRVAHDVTPRASPFLVLTVAAFRARLPRTPVAGDARRNWRTPP